MKQINYKTERKCVVLVVQDCGSHPKNVPKKAPKTPKTSETNKHHYLDEKLIFLAVPY